MKIGGLRVGGTLGLCPERRKVRHIPILSYHNKWRTTWLWALNLRRAIADERRAFRYLHIAGHQDQRALQLWAWSIQFTWQESGRYKDYAHQKRSYLSRLFGIKFD